VVDRIADRGGMALGFPALLAFLAIFWLMVAKGW
jgi:uncharacterized membrane protein